MSAINAFYQAIIDTNTIGAVEDDWTGAIYIEIGDERMYCTPNWEGAENEIGFGFVNSEGDYIHWEIEVVFTGDIKSDVAKWEMYTKTAKRTCEAMI